jgi:hypothetical protein
MAKTTRKIDLEIYYKQKISPHLARMPWLLRITDNKKRPSPVLVIKYHKPIDEDSNQTRLVERGLLHGDSLRRCLPGIRKILSRVHDENDRHLDLHQFLLGKTIKFRGNLPLDQTAGAKLALLFRLQERVKDLDRVELIARRIDNFTEEEATYWLSRILHFGRASNRWAIAGMRIMLGGLAGDPEITKMLREISTQD